MPAVSALVAAYKAGDYLREAVGSALAQTFADLEVVVSDDAADPAVEELVRGFADPRVRYRSNPARLGPAGNHRAALAAARGEFVAVLNHDDRWEPDFLARLVPPLATDPRLVLSFCDHHLMDAAGRERAAATDANTRFWGRDRLSAGRQPDLPGLVVRGSIPLAMGAVFRRAAVDPADLPDAAGPAYDLWLAYLLARTGGAAHYDPARLTAWREHPANLTTAGGADWAAGAVGCWERAAADPLFRPHRRPVGRKLAEACRALARKRVAAGDTAAARRLAVRAVRAGGLDWRNPALLALTLVGRGGRA